MAFKGDLTNISMFDVFQTLNTNQQTGVLVLQRAGVTKKIFFSPTGVRMFFMRAVRVLRLGEIFVRRGSISAEDVEILLMQQKQEYRPFGELLIETGKVTEEEIQRTLRYHAEDEIYEIFGWESGTFSFFDGETDTDHANTPLSEIVLDPGSLCLEAARRLDEMERLRATVPSDDDFYVRNEGAQIDREAGSLELTAVFDALGKPTYVDELRDVVGMSRFEVLRALVELVEANVARALDTTELADEGRKWRDLGSMPRAAKLFALAHEREPDDATILEDAISVLAKLNKPSQLAAMLAKLGAIRARDGDHEKAVEHLEQALRHNPGNRNALITLRDCFAAGGDLERASESSLRIARSYAETQDITGAIEACRAGLAITPDAIALRYYFAQLLARMEETALAQAELRELIESARTEKRALRNRKTRELLSSCYRLLLRLDPEDSFAEKGLKQLERHSGERVRRRRLLMRLSVAAAVLLLIGGVGLALMPKSAADLLEEAHELHAEGDLEGMTALVQRIQEEFPGSAEAQQALGLGHIVSEEERQRLEAEAVVRRGEIQKGLEPRLKTLGEQLRTGDIQQAAGMLAETLKELRSGPGYGAGDAEFLQELYLPDLTLRVENFFERAREEMEKDIRYVSSAQQVLRDEKSLTKARLEEVVGRLTAIRQRDWSESALRVDAYVVAALDTGLLKSIAERAAEFRRFFATRVNAFSQLTQVYYHAKSLELKENIRLAMEDARTKGRDLLAQCEFDEARKYYEKVIELTLSARGAEVREHFQEVIAWIVRRNIERSAKRSLDDIDEVTRSLEEATQLRAAGRTDAAYRLMRALIKEHRLIQFERRYNLPYRIDSRPAGAKVFVNDKEVGKAPCDIEIPIVERTEIRIEAPGFLPLERTLTIADPSLDGLLDVAMSKVMAWERSLRTSPEARPIMAGPLVLVPTNEASLLALRATDGEQMWEATTGLLDRIKSTPMADAEHAHFVTIGGHYFAVSLKTGEITWKLDLPGEIQHDGTLVNGTIYFATRNRKLVAIRDGKLLFERDLEFDPVTSIQPIGTEIVFGTADGYVVLHSRATGDEVRRLRSADRSSFFGGVTTTRDAIIGAAEDGHVYRFEPAKDKFVWRYRMTGNLTSAPIAGRGSVYLPTAEGFLWRIAPGGTRGDRIDVRKGFNGTPVLDRDFLYAAAGKRLLAYDLVTESHWWEVAFETEQPVHIAANESMVVVVTDHGRIVAYPGDPR